MKHLFDVDVLPNACVDGNCGCAQAPLSESAALTEAIRERYTRVAERGADATSMTAACCDNASALYSQDQLNAITAEAAGASAGCGNPVGLAGVGPGENVLDLGSGGGIDCFLAAKSVGPRGHVYGVDMTHEMVALARRNAAKLGVDNVTFLLGQIEAVPLPDSSVDLVVSNCVLALAPDKDLVFQEIYRLLRPGGRLFISDVVTEVELPEQTRTDPEQWVACIAGADLKSRYLERIQRAGFEDVALVTDSQFDSSCAEDGPDAWRASLRSVTVKAFRPKAHVN